jgi:NADPH:quinone reductase-like Zn-dependent oxidoreductase
MQAWVTDGDGISQLRQEERADPVLGPDEALIRVHAVSLNWRDLRIVAGQYGGKQRPGLIPTSDMSGIVEQVGERVSTLKPGDHVINLAIKQWPAGKLRSDWTRTFLGCSDVDGMLVERIAYPAESLVKAPSHMTHEQACTLPIAGLTAWAALVTHGELRPGQWVLVHGTGGVSVFAAQLAKYLGARVILSTSTDKKSAWAKQHLGVDEVINYRDEEWPKRVMEITGKRGVDLVVEVAGGESLAKSMQVCAYYARVMVIGVVAGFESTIDTMQFIRKQIRVQGIFMESAQELESFARACEAMKLEPVIDRMFSFNEAPKAYERLQSGEHMGKVVISGIAK